jgi:hypothetical protein
MTDNRMRQSQLCPSMLQQGAVQQLLLSTAAAHPLLAQSFSSNEENLMNLRHSSRHDDLRSRSKCQQLAA